MSHGGLLHSLRIRTPHKHPYFYEHLAYKLLELSFVLSLSKSHEILKGCIFVLCAVLYWVHDYEVLLLIMECDGIHIWMGIQFLLTRLHVVCDQKYNVERNEGWHTIFNDKVIPLTNSV